MFRLQFRLACAFDSCDWIRNVRTEQLDEGVAHTLVSVVGPARSSANASYSASLDAYQYGVKNLVDVLTAEKQLAQARLSSVSARSELFIQAVNPEFVSGNLLRNQPPATRLQSQDGHQ